MRNRSGPQEQVVAHVVPPPAVHAVDTVNCGSLPTNPINTMTSFIYRLRLRSRLSKFLTSTLLTLFLFIYPFHADSTQSCNYQTITKVIDGDTFELPDGAKVRLIGVDTPETVDPREDVQWFGREAAKKLKEWISGKRACLKRDRDRTQDIDKYGRLLRYVWLEPTHTEKDSFFVNAELIKQGYAFTFTVYPFQYLEDFKKYEREARENDRGLWNKKKQEIWEKEVERNKSLAITCGKDKTICPENALKYIGKHMIVRFFVRKSYDSSKAIFLNSKNDYSDYDNFTAVIFAENKNKFPGEPADYYWGKTIDVKGEIKEYKGRAEIILENPSQIRVLR